MQDCCKKWLNAYIMPYWDITCLIETSTDAMEVPKYCPGCRRKLHHTREFNLEKDRPAPTVRLPYPTGKKE